MVYAGDAGIVKVLLAGLGSVGQRHARNLRAMFGAGVELLAWRVRGDSAIITETMTLDRSVSVEHQLNIRSFASLDAALHAQPTAAIICNPSSMHVPTALAALSAGCHVLIEKPLSHSWHDVEHLIETATATNRVAAVCYQLRCHEVLRRLRELLDRGAVGQVQTVSAMWSEYLPDAHPYEDYRVSYAAQRALGGGVILCFIHELDYLIWLFGMPAEVSAVGGRLSDLDIDVEDTAEISLRSPGGPAIDVRLCFGERVRTRGCSIVGTDGRISIDLLAATLEWRDAAGAIRETYAVPGFQRNELFVGVLTDFFGAIEHGFPPLVPVADGARSLRVALAAGESIRLGRPVRIAA